ncbi:MAG: hypothetical protein ACJ714_13750 [Ornithinibacter sp.]
MRKFRAALAVAALAAVALLVPTTASAAPVHGPDQTRATTLAVGWDD